MKILIIEDERELSKSMVTVKELAKITKYKGEINYEAAIKGKVLIFDAAGKFLKEVKD